jgi:flagellar biogenesis protein FliO
VTITLVPLIFAMQYTPDLKAGSSAVLELAAQLKWALAGLLLAVLILGWVLKGFIRRQAGQRVTEQPAPAAVV